MEFIRNPLPKSKNLDFGLIRRSVWHSGVVRYWWVNHAQTMRQEVAGCYLWSPLTEANGARSKFYDNMRSASPGDIVLSYAEGKVGRIGIVADFAISAPKPEEFGAIGAYWNLSGWLLPVKWQDAVLAVRPKDLLPRLSPLLPATHSPIQPMTGNGNQKAYLAEVDRAVVDLILEAAHLSAATLSITPDFTVADFATRLEDIVEHGIQEDTSLDHTVRTQLIKARRGQGVFRKRVLDIEPVCRITGINNPALLVASHIKPWRACATSAERLDGANGLMLAPHADFLFDRGFIGFEENGRAIFSSKLAATDADKFGIHRIGQPPPLPLSDYSFAYLRYHRTKVFIP